MSGAPLRWDAFTTAELEAIGDALETTPHSEAYLKAMYGEAVADPTRQIADALTRGEIIGQREATPAKGRIAPMTTEERFERIETTLLATADTLKALAESHVATQAATASFAQAQETIADMAASIGKYVDAADARMKRLEENLDGLIRAIAAEHSNGKNKQ